MKAETWAFPGVHTVVRHVDEGDGGISTYHDTVPHQGMSLRDYFAGQAMPAIIQGDPEGKLSSKEVAKLAFDQADAMMKAGFT